MGRLCTPLVVAAVTCAAAIDPSIESDTSGVVTIRLPQGARAQVSYVDAQGNVVSTSALATMDDINRLESEAAVTTRAIYEQIASLNTSKQTITAAHTAEALLQAGIRDALQSISALEYRQGNLTALASNQTYCHSQGLIYNVTSGRCGLALTISCGTIVPEVISLNRAPGLCGGAHFPGDTCQSPCASGYTGPPQTYTCGLDGVWQSAPAPGRCTNINECAVNQSLCSQTCVDFDGGYRCTCRAGYLLQSDLRSCVPVVHDATRFPYTYGRYTFVYTVPVGANRITIVALGSGGANAYGRNGGAGALVEATVDARSGQRLTVAVGGPGNGYLQPPNSTIVPGYFHAPGGGLVGVFLGQVINQANALVIAGSGGGAGSNQARNGGDGGGQGRGYPASGSAASSRCLGQGARANAGGLGGGLQDTLGTAGQALRGGQGGAYGSGGGAGYFGGGGGGHCSGVCGCGGGGGSSFVVAGAANVTIRRGAGGAGGVGGNVLLVPLT